MSVTFNGIQDVIEPRHVGCAIGFLQAVAGDQRYGNVCNVRTTNGRIEEEDDGNDADKPRGVTHDLKGSDFNSLQPSQHNLVHTPCFDNHGKEHAGEGQMFRRDTIHPTDQTQQMRYEWRIG